MLLEEMYRGNFCPADHFSPAKHTEYREISQKITQLTEQLEQNLSADDKNLLDQLIAQIYTAQCIEQEDIFCYAFACGIVLHDESYTQITM